MLSPPAKIAATAGLAAAVISGMILWTWNKPARALPSFAAQTGQPCSACHIGAFGPQLTPLGRAFKIGGYTQTGGQGLLSQIPLAAMTIGSFTHTQTDQPEPPEPHFGDNNNFAWDLASWFFAGRVTDFLGAFVQGTYDGVTRSVSLDNTDIRLTTPLNLGNSELRMGLDVNNGPTIQDPYNSTYAWIFPFTTSALAPTPTAQPLLAGGLFHNTIGTTVYGWYDRSLYFEAGGYTGLGPTALRVTGNSLGPGAITNYAPYLRLAYEWNWAGQSAHIGGLAFYAALNPATGPISSDGSFGRDQYVDYGIDGGYQFLGDGTHTATVDAIFLHEYQNLKGSFNMGTSSQPVNHLNQARINLTYFYQRTYGINFGWQNTWGNANPAFTLQRPSPAARTASQTAIALSSKPIGFPSENRTPGAPRLRT